MSEFFLELFSEEIPAGLQKNLREKLLEDFQNLFEKKLIKSKKSFSLSTPNRLVLVFEGLDKQIKIKSEQIKGPKIDASNQAIEGFMRSNKLEKKEFI
jgi:Glycyl-tRNA synthetase, beta subunit